MFWCWLPFVTLSFQYCSKYNNILAQHHCNNITVTTTNANTSTKCNTVVHDITCCTKCNNNNWSYPDNGAKCDIYSCHNIFYFGLILVTVPYLIPGNLFINALCAHAVFERSTNREWHNPSGTFSDGQGDPLEQSCLDVDNSKTRTLCQQLTIIYCSMFRLHTVERERICKGLWTDTKRPPPSPTKAPLVV